MRPMIRTFGSNGPATFTIERDDACPPAPIRRELWFDQDVDGQWLICAVEPEGRGRAGGIGAVVLTDPRVADFIDTLAQLVEDPAQFRDEPRFYSTH